MAVEKNPLCYKGGLYVFHSSMGYLFTDTNITTNFPNEITIM